ncbi:hypothetical protein [Methylobacterium sp. J-068]|uniref:hypothetical protein n=1 Tax=Methylobacterium sp. J-068 TaxID=2836649 RepID=UPI001FB8E7F2|nr:hypothetical protein [Methylobacterium sp. J-068]MCJ2033424.1 hypothetical protein [Methylobacterium sp. J-068]
MPILQIHDILPTERCVVDPRAVLTMLGERAIRASWQIAGVARYDEPLFVTGEAEAHLEVLSQAQERIAGSLLSEFADQVTQVIWGEFIAYENGQDAPWVIVRAIDSSWCEVETDDGDVLARVRETFVDVRMVP